MMDREIPETVWQAMAAMPIGTIFHRHPTGDGFISSHPDHEPRWIKEHGDWAGTSTPCEPYQHPTKELENAD